MPAPRHPDRHLERARFLEQLPGVRLDAAATGLQQLVEVRRRAVHVHEVPDVALELRVIVDEAPVEEALEALADEDRRERRWHAQRVVPYEAVARQQVPPPRRRLTEAGGRHEAEPLDELGPSKGHVQRDRAAERVADHGRTVDLEPLEQLREELLVEGEQARHAGVGGAPERRYVERDDAVAGEEARHDAAPAVGGVAVSVDQEDRRPLARVVEEGGHAAHIDRPVGDLPAPGVVQPRVSRTATHLFSAKSDLPRKPMCQTGGSLYLRDPWLACSSSAAGAAGRRLRERSSRTGTPCAARPATRPASPK